MIFQGKKIFNASFNVFADNYHSVRPGYPAEMYDDVKQLCGFNSNSRLLEIGAGSGIATAKLAEIGGEIIGIEPGTNLVGIAKKETAGFNNVKIIETMFEDFESAEKFDAILALTAFHWIDEHTKYQKVLDLLKYDGHLVLVWNSFFQSESAVVTEVNQAYKDFLPDVYQGDRNVNEAVLSKLGRRAKEVNESDLFHTVFLRRYLTTYNYDARTYPKLLNTFPNIVRVADDRRERFLLKIAEIVQQHSTISVPVMTTLIVCQRKDFFLELVSKN